MSTYKVGEQVWGLDEEKNIVHHCLGTIEKIHTRADGISIYFVRFEHGSFLLAEHQLTNNINNL